jgi:hypothetical protein
MTGAFAGSNRRHRKAERRGAVWSLMGGLWLHGGAKPQIPALGFNTRKINLSQVFAGQMVGIKQLDERIWLVSFMRYDLGYFDDETCRLEPVANLRTQSVTLSPE